MVKAVPVEFQYELVVADIYKKKIRNAVKKMFTVRRKISLMKDVKIGRRFEEIIIILVDIGVQNL